jgi:hypothetical protein
MPSTVAIASFVFGAVLLLLGLVGGRFKLFGSEFSGTLGPAGRAAALVMGAGFIIWGLVHDGRPPAVETGPAPRPGVAAAVPARELAPTPAPIGLAEMWQDETGTIYRVTPNGSNYYVVAHNSYTGISAEGYCTVQGLNWTSSFQTSKGSAGTGTGTLSADGNQMVGVFRDNQFGTYSRTITRMQ